MSITFTCIRIRKTLETLATLGSSGTKLLLTSWLLVFSTRGERHTIFTMLTVPSDPITRGASRRPNWTRLISDLNSLTQQTRALPAVPTGLVKIQIPTNCFFSKITQNPQPSLPGITSFTSQVLFPIRGFYYNICDCHILPAQAWTPALNVCPYPCTKPNSSKPN